MEAFPTALDTAQLIRSKEVSPGEVLDETLARIDKYNPALNAVIWRDDAAARADAARLGDAIARNGTDGLAAFAGVPIPVKDLTAAAGQPLTHGSWGASDEPAAEDELVVAAFRRAGMVLTGRTNTPEFGPITAAENDRYGISRNPWNTDHTPGGSSGGAASAVAAGMFSVAHANDGGGSIRIPASCCGLVGLKVSRGRVPARVTSWEGSAVEGVVTHTVADTAAVLDLIAQPDPLCWYNAPPPVRPFVDEIGADPGRLRIGLVDTGPFGMPVADACRDAVHAAGRSLESLGHSVEPVSFEIDFDKIASLLVVIDGSRTEDIADWSKVEPHNQLARERGLSRSSIEYVTAVGELQRWTRTVAARWGHEFDVMVTPTLSIEPPPAGQILAETKADPANPSGTVFSMVVFTMIFNVTGLPAISLPLHQSASGLPIGVQLVERPFNDAGVLRLAAQLEEAMPWRDRHPAL
jgi:amidase